MTPRPTALVDYAKHLYQVMAGVELRRVEQMVKAVYEWVEVDQ